MLGLNAFIVNQILIALNEQSGLMYSLNNHIVSIDIMRIRGHMLTCSQIGRMEGEYS